MTLHDLMSFWVDFNAIRDDGRLAASLRYSSGWRIPSIDEVVVLHDHDGNRCEGRVIAHRGRIIDVEPDLSSWATSSDLLIHAGSVEPRVTTRWDSPTENESSRLRPVTLA